MDAMTNADKKAKQDKWMTLAQMGLSMMSSQQPNFLASVGEAGAAAIPAFQKDRDTADNTKLALSKGLYDIDQQRQARAAAASASSTKSGISSLGALQKQAAIYKIAGDQIDTQLTNLGYTGQDITKMSPEQANTIGALLKQRQAVTTALLGIAGVAPTAVDDGSAPIDVPVQ